MEVQEFTDILSSPPVDSLEDDRELAPGASITWNLLVGTLAPVPLIEGDEKAGEYSYGLDDLVEMRDNFYRDTLGVKPSVYIGHEFRYSGTPAMGTVLNLAIVENGLGFDLWFETLWVPEGKYKIDTQEFKYVSLESNNKDNGTWTLTAIALTNTPAYTPMMEVKASSEIGGTMEDFMKFIDPKKYLEYLRKDEKGEEILVEFYKNYSGDFVEEKVEEKVEGADGEKIEEKVEVKTEGAEPEATEEIKEEKKEVIASSTQAQLEKELAILAPLGNKWTTAQQKAAFNQAIPLAYTESPITAVKKAISILMGLDTSRTPAPSGSEVSASASRITVSEFDKQTQRFLNKGGQ